MKESAGVESMLRHYAPNFAEAQRGVVAVALPLGSIEAIERISRDLVAFGFGMGEAVAKSRPAVQQLEWFERADLARLSLMENVRALADVASPSSTGETKA